MCRCGKPKVNSKRWADASWFIAGARLIDLEISGSWQQSGGVPRASRLADRRSGRANHPRGAKSEISDGIHRPKVAPWQGSMLNSVALEKPIRGCPDSVSACGDRIRSSWLPQGKPGFACHRDLLGDLEGYELASYLQRRISMRGSACRIPVSRVPAFQNRASQIRAFQIRASQVREIWRHDNAA